MSPVPTKHTSLDTCIVRFILRPVSTGLSRSFKFTFNMHAVTYPVRSLLKPVLPKGVTVSTGHRDMLRRLAEELCCGRPDKADQLDSKFSVTCQLMRQAAVGAEA